MDIEFVRNVLVLERDLNLGQFFWTKTQFPTMFQTPKKFLTTSKSDFTSFYIDPLIFREIQIFRFSKIQ